MANIEMPQLGETVTEGTITKWHKQVGDAVAEDEVLFEVSTDKVDSEVPSPASGYLAEIKVNEGDTVDVGTVLAVVSDAPPDGSAAPRLPPTPRRAGRAAPAAPPSPGPPPPPRRAGRRPRPRPRARLRPPHRRRLPPPPPCPAPGSPPAPQPPRASVAPTARCCRRWCAA